MRAVATGIEDRIRSIIRADYDKIAYPDLPEWQLPSEFAFFRITELARFWDAPQTGGESLAERQQRLITSLSGIRSPWAYAVLGGGGVASVFLGLPCREGGARLWEQSLAAQLPGSLWQMEQSSSQILGVLAGFPVVASLSGNPSIVVHEDRQSELGRHLPGLESVFETMAGVRWAYMVLARPMAEQEVADDVQRTEAELQDTNSAFRRRGSAEENNNPLVARYVSLLESAHQKLLQGQRHGMWDVQSYLMADTETDCACGAQALHAVFGGSSSEPQPFRIKIGRRESIRDLGVRMSTRLNTSEVAVLASLPRREVAGLQVSEYVPFGLTGGEGGEHGIVLGKLMSGGSCTSRWLGVQLESLCKHAFIAGVPGSGKTRTCLYLLYQLWREQGIPWLVLEPSMKSEYRALLHSDIGSVIRVFTAGDESISPLRLNPLEVPAGVHVQTHIGSIASLFKATFAMEAPMPYVLDEAIHKVYEDRGWDFVLGSHPNYGPECQPTLSDLLETCGLVIHDLGHEERVKANIWGALKTRLTSLMRGAKGRMLNVRESDSMDDLLSVPTVIEFSAIGDDDEKAFLLGCILLKLNHHRQKQGTVERELRHVTLIEEAHRLLRNVPETAGTVVANPRRQAVEAFSNMLAELRAFGEGLVVVDQMPSKLVPDVIQNSGLKVIHRLTAEEERRIVGGAMSLNDAQTRFLSSLPVGQAIVYSDGSANACRICIPDHAGCGGYLREHPSNAEVSAHMKEHIQRAAVTQAMDSTVTVGVPASDVLCQCVGTCPADSCAAKDAVDRYAGRHSGELEASFQTAVRQGFDALWQFGVGIVPALWPGGSRGADLPFCAVMTVAGKTGMARQDILVLRQNMIRLYEKHQHQGDRL